ncbi:MAG: hypothetical protein ACYTHM_08690, partial [Planctomycetota bacterium]
EYYAFDPKWELVEVISSPFLFLTVLPMSIAMLPVELAVTGGGEKDKEFYFFRMFKLPFAFLNPFGNADQWVDLDNVYKKKPEVEEAGFRTEIGEETLSEERHENAAGAKIKIHVPEVDRTFQLEADDRGKVRLPIAVDMAEVSQLGKGLTLKVTVQFKEKEVEGEFQVGRDTLEGIYEALKLE